ncbi:MAG: hypothetical protein GY861_17495 [bacterium]|nr:hypothetical protein [bacterium]
MHIHNPAPATASDITVVDAGGFQTCSIDGVPYFRFRKSDGQFQIGAEMDTDISL